MWTAIDACMVHTLRYAQFCWALCYFGYFLALGELYDSRVTLKAMGKIDLKLNYKPQHKPSTHDLY